MTKIHCSVGVLSQIAKDLRKEANQKRNKKLSNVSIALINSADYVKVKSIKRESALLSMYKNS